METISMLEIRRNAKGLVERLGRGESFRITYRNRTVGELFPPKVRYEISPDDPVYRIAEMAEDLGGGLDSREIDRIVYGQ
jgi:antitoxin (DNA-binding transcriptional repressor) of toxin-antitoxin stability system